jgi:allophanate hydrolase
LTQSASSLDFARLRARYRDGATVATVVDDVAARVAAAGDDHVWIARVPADEIRAQATALDRRAAAEPGLRERLPLFGVPFAVKDNIDAAGMPTTAGCPAFAYSAAADAPVVARLRAAGALLVGKTNLDQFATGLVGVRSPYGVPRNPFDARYIPGGSSSGSAVAVAGGLVSFALGTDTAGSGRVPAAFNNIVGLKPTRGRLSARGVVPACRSLDCVSIFALSADDAAAVLDVAGGFDAADPLSREAPAETNAFAAPLRFAVPRPEDLAFFGDAEAPGLFAAAAAALEALGAARVEIDFAPFRETAPLLYSGPWVAERLVAVESLMGRQPEALLPVTRQIIAGGAKYSAVDYFGASYRLAELRRAADATWRAADLLLVPTAGTIYTVAEIEADPIALNGNLGYYTNFTNLLDLAAVALPAGFYRNGMPFGVSLIAPAFSDTRLAALGTALQRRLDLPLGATAHRLPAAQPADAAKADDSSRIQLAVVGAHLSGMPLNHQLTERGARLVRQARTAPVYRMFLIAGEPPRPGLVRTDRAGTAIDVEIWSLDAAGFGALVADVAPPLAIGTLQLEDGTAVKGFLCESAATLAARDISEFGGWRRFVAGQG